jgi:D-alanine transaminase
MPHLEQGMRANSQVGWRDVETAEAMTTLANWNGTEMPLEDVRVPALDRAFLFGDAVYEVIRIYGGRLWRLSDHLDRLATGLSELQICYSIETLEKTLRQTLLSSAEKEALAYIQVTRGAAQRRRHNFPDDARPNCLIYIERFDDGAIALLREQGGKAVLIPDIRWSRNDLKVTSLLANCLASQKAHAQGCLEAIMVDKNGMLTEASHSSVFAVRQGTLMVSPKSPTVLSGITKRQVIELCQRSHIPMEEGRITESAVFELDELIVTDTVDEIVPIVKLNDKPIGRGTPGPIAQKLQQAFKQSIVDWLAAVPE